MVLIFDSIRIIYPHVSDAVKERNLQVIQDFSTQQTEAWAGYIYLNSESVREARKR